MAGKKKIQNAAPIPELKTPTQIKWVVMDLGNGFSKMLCSGQQDPIRWRSVQGHVGRKTRMNQLPHDWTIKWRGNYYVFGDRAYTECPDTMEDFPTTDRYTSDWYKRMFAFALHKAYGLHVSQGADDPPYAPEIVASVPAKEYANPARLEAIKENLYGLYQIETVLGTATEIEVSDANLTLLPEGAGSFLFMAAQGNNALEKGLWAVLDLGYLTGDVVFFKDGVYVADSSDSDDKLGMINVSQRVAESIRGQGGPSLSAAEIDPVVNQPFIEVSGTPYSISDTYHESMYELGRRAASFLQRKCVGKNISGILLTGGNVANQAPFIASPKLPQPVVCMDGENGNIRGASIMVQAG